MNYINREHPDYAAQKATWRKYKDLYAGGERMRQNASEYLVRRGREPGDVYAERLSRVFYENYAGSIIDWYAATLLRREPVLTYDGANEAGKRFFNAFAENCDLKGSTLTDFYRRRFIEALVFGKSYIAVDFPRTGEHVMTRAEEDHLGRSRAYLVEYSPEEVINWSYDEDGNLEWVVLRATSVRQEKVTDSGWVKETHWVYYDRENFKVFRRSENGEGSAIELVSEGCHGLAFQHRVPVFELRVSDGLWLMNKSALVQLEHFNKSNALSWALTMGLFAMPVVYSERDFNQIVGESYYIQLGKDDRFGWTEPEGKVYQIAANNLVKLKEEIYRVCYLMAQSGGAGLDGAAQSGLSKLRDFSVTQEVLRAYGDMVKDSMKQVLRAIAAARKDELTLDVSGLDEFDIGDFSAELDDAKKLLEMGIESETLKKQLFKKLAFKYLCDARQEVKSRIAEEIDRSFER
jgi:hypothetical protein